jgi:dolichol-phosphate mannosyltransferase
MAAENQDFFVVLPAYNEEGAIEKTLKDVLKYSKPENVIVVDDGSQDETFKEARRCNVRVLRHVVNLGKGAALKTGCDYAIKKHANKIVLMDSDGQHDPSYIPKFVSLLDKYDVVLGARKRTKDMPHTAKFGNLFFDVFVKFFLGKEIIDTQGGFRAFRAEKYPLLKWKSSDYTVETEMLVHIVEQNLSYTQIPIKTIYTDNYKGTTVLDGFKIVFNILKFRLFG